MTRVLIYIRHGNDRSVDNKHCDDRHLSDAGRRKASRVAKLLIQEHGHPSIAYVSPFHRTVETLEAMTEQFDRPVTVIRDPRIAQYFGKKRRGNLEIGRAVAGVISIDEDKRDFRRRVEQHLDDANRSDVVVWCITHTIVLEYVSHYLDEPISEPVKFLDHLVIDGPRIIERAPHPSRG